MPSYNADRAFGDRNQRSVLQLLNAYYGEDHIEQSRYATFDFHSVNDTRRAEVKSRRCSSRGYPYALLGGNKVDAARRLHPNKTIVFIWVYEDETLFIEYDPAVFDTFHRAMYQRGSRDGINDTPADTVWVPINLLRPLRIPEVPAATTDGPSPPTAPLPSPSVAAT
jgi:hypothetical protein